MRASIPTIRSDSSEVASKSAARFARAHRIGVLILLGALFHPAVDHDDRVEREPPEWDKEERRCLSSDQNVACPNDGGHDGHFAPSAERPRRWRSIHGIRCSGSAAGSGRRQIAAPRSGTLVHSSCGAVGRRAETTKQSTISREPQRALAWNGAPYGTRTRVTAVKERLHRPWLSSGVCDKSEYLVKMASSYPCVSAPVRLHLCRTFAVRPERGRIDATDPS